MFPSRTHLIIEIVNEFDNSILKNMYSGASTTVRVGQTKLDESYEVNLGLREGSCLSPTLYAIFINDLLEELQAAKIGCQFEAAGTPMANIWTGALMYADDLVLLAKSEAEIRALTKILGQHGHKWVRGVGGFVTTRLNCRFSNLQAALF